MVAAAPSTRHPWAVKEDTPGRIPGARRSATSTPGGDLFARQPDVRNGVETPEPASSRDTSSC